MLVEERAEGAWINLHDMLVPLPPSTPSSNNDGSSTSSGGAGFRFLWASERSGYRQLYLYEYQPGGTGTGTGTGTGAGQGATCLLDGQPVGGGGPWIVERYPANTSCIPSHR